MRISALLTYIGAVCAVPKTVGVRESLATQTAVYWGQNGGEAIENDDLSYYCKPESGIDVILLAFLYSYGNGQISPSGTIGRLCFISAGAGQNCEALAAAIDKCKAAGVKIILSLGGAAGSYTLTSLSEAEAIAENLWNSYGNSSYTTVQRPFGDTFVNGFDFDLEFDRGSAYYPAMIATLRSLFATDPSNTYYITAAPQCPIPEPNMGIIISNASFDYLFIQFYNNAGYNPPCALPFNNLNVPFNYDQWVSFTADSASANAKIFIGVPASPLGATGYLSGEEYYITPDQLSSLVSEYQSHPRFGGIMMWSAAFSDANINNACTYAQEAHAILLTGAPCTSGPISGGGDGDGLNITSMWTSSVTIRTDTQCGENTIFPSSSSVGMSCSENVTSSVEFAPARSYTSDFVCNTSKGRP